MDIDAEPANNKLPEANRRRGRERRIWQSDINPSERKTKDQTRQPSALPALIIQSAAVLEAVKARPGNVEVCLYGGATADLDSFCARRRAKSTVGAEESLRRGRTKESAKAKEESAHRYRA
jgi:hypothetical protein